MRACGSSAHRYDFDPQGASISTVRRCPNCGEENSEGARFCQACGTALEAEPDEEFQRERGVTLAIRTGITSGEVVAGDPSAGQRLVTGDTVNTAARLEQAAQPGEILIGEPTLRLVRDAVEVEPVDPLTVK